ncbi:oral cancer overexpressed 1 [Amazona aestiva]|uniref:Oral cancer overexpressed 1 n=1 Tax=Amazona aestiva TaxID=12930 RepID=A0A0Q3RF00_AMAAE|nr:oral cancer overexpressed 1 [Amazona aestiva]
MFEEIVMAEESKKIRALDSLIRMIQKFPYEDPTYDKLQEDLEKIRGKFKQLNHWESEQAPNCKCVKIEAK